MKFAKKPKSPWKPNAVVQIIDPDGGQDADDFDQKGGTVIATIDAEVYAFSVREQYFADQAVGETSHSVRIIYRPMSNSYQFRVLPEGRILDIEGGVNEGQANDFLSFRCRELA